MSFEISLAMRGDLAAWERAHALAIRQATRDAIEAVTHHARDLLRDDLRRAGLGELDKTWRAELFPRRGLADNPAGFIYSRAEYLIEAFSSDRPIRPQQAQRMAIPIPGSPAESLRNPRGPDDKVDEARRRFGELDLVPGIPGGRPPMLVAKNVSFTKTGRLSRRRLTKSGRYGARAASVPLFFLVEEVRLGKRIDPERIARAAERLAPSRLERELDKRLRVLAQEGGRR